MRSRLATFLLLLLSPVLAAAEPIKGLIVDEAGSPLEGVLVEWLQTSKTAVSNVQGEFEIDGPDGSGELKVSLSGRAPRLIPVTPDRLEPLAIALEPLEVLQEEITVAALPLNERAPVTLAATSISTEDLAVPPSTLAELAAQSSSVSENGQGGLFQVVSIRGVSRQRVRSVMSGVPLTSERRAGVSGSFIDPQLLGSVNVVRGAASAIYGSGALGGLIESSPRSFDGIEYRSGFTDEGSETYQTIGWGNPDKQFSLGLAVRRADNSESADGEELASGYQQGSAILRKVWSSSSEVGDILRSAAPSILRSSSAAVPSI